MPRRERSQQVTVFACVDVELEGRIRALAAGMAAR